MTDSDSDDLSDEVDPYELVLQRERENARQTFTELCAALKEMNVSEVRIQYDGYSDSGAVEDVSAKGPDGEEVEIPASFEGELAGAAEFLLPDGWENGEGAFGEIVLDVASRRVTREHNWRFESSEYEEESWEL